MQIWKKLLCVWFSITLYDSNKKLCQTNQNDDATLCRLLKQRTKSERREKRKKKEEKITHSNLFFNRPPCININFGCFSRHWNIRQKWISILSVTIRTIIRKDGLFVVLSKKLLLPSHVLLNIKPIRWQVSTKWARSIYFKTIIINHQYTFFTIYHHYTIHFSVIKVLDQKLTCVFLSFSDVHQHDKVTIWWVINIYELYNKIKVKDNWG